MTIDNTQRFVRRPEVLHITGLSRSHMYKLAKDGNFPRPIKLSAKAVAWRLTDLMRWMDDRIARSA